MQFRQKYPAGFARSDEKTARTFIIDRHRDLLKQEMSRIFLNSPLHLYVRPIDIIRKEQALISSRIIINQEYTCVIVSV